jgi:hypothetical protein
MKNPDFADDPLFVVERRIARRADELSRDGCTREQALEHWRQAEAEVWESYTPAAEPAISLHGHRHG